MSEVATNSVPSAEEIAKVSIPQRIPRPSDRIIEKIAYQAAVENDRFDVVFHKWMETAEKVYDKKYPSPQPATAIENV